MSEGFCLRHLKLKTSQIIRVSSAGVAPNHIHHVYRLFSVSRSIYHQWTARSYNSSTHCLAIKSSAMAVTRRTSRFGQGTRLAPTWISGSQTAKPRVRAKHKSEFCKLGVGHWLVWSFEPSEEFFCELPDSQNSYSELPSTKESDEDDFDLNSASRGQPFEQPHETYQRGYSAGMVFNTRSVMAKSMARTLVAHSQKVVRSNKLSQLPAGSLSGSPTGQASRFRFDPAAGPSTHVLVHQPEQACATALLPASVCCVC